MDPRLEPLADVLVELVVREIQANESRRLEANERGGLEDQHNEEDTPTAEPALPRGAE